MTRSSYRYSYHDRSRSRSRDRSRNHSRWKSCTRSRDRLEHRSRYQSRSRSRSHRHRHSYRRRSPSSDYLSDSSSDRPSSRSGSRRRLQRSSRDRSRSQSQPHSHQRHSGRHTRHRGSQRQQTAPPVPAAPALRSPDGVATSSGERLLELLSRIVNLPRPAHAPQSPPYQAPGFYTPGGVFQTSPGRAPSTDCFPSPECGFCGSKQHIMYDCASVVEFAGCRGVV